MNFFTYILFLLFIFLIFNLLFIYLCLLVILEICLLWKWSHCSKWLHRLIVIIVYIFIYWTFVSGCINMVWFMFLFCCLTMSLSLHFTEMVLCIKFSYHNFRDSTYVFHRRIDLSVFIPTTKLMLVTCHIKWVRCYWSIS